MERQAPDGAERNARRLRTRWLSGLAALAAGGGLWLATRGLPAPGPARAEGRLAFWPAPRAEPAPFDPPAAPPDARARLLAGLQALLEQEAARLNGELCVHVRLEGGGEAGVHDERPVEAASVIKLPVMGALYAAWESGALPRTAEDERRLRAMITLSRNSATNALIRRLGMGRINAWLAGEGYTVTRLGSLILDPKADAPNLVTAAEMTRMLESIVEGRLVSPAASAEMRRLLEAQRWRSRIPAGLPPEAVVGNKTGTLRCVLHDVGFVETPFGLRYTLAILVERRDRTAVREEALARLSRRIYQYLATGGLVAPGPPLFAAPQPGAPPPMSR